MKYGKGTSTGFFKEAVDNLSGFGGYCSSRVVITCAQCGVEKAIPCKKHWAYKVYSGGKHVFFCTHKCLVAWERAQEAQKQAEKARRAEERRKTRLRTEGP